MIWEQKITLPSPLQSVRLDSGSDGHQDSTTHEASPRPGEDTLSDAPATGARPVADAADERTASNQLLTKLVELLQQRRRSNGEATRDLQVAAIEIAVAVVEKLYISRVEQGDQDLERLVNEAVALLDPAGPVTVRVHPEDALEAAVSAIPGNELTLVADDHIQRGNCQIGNDQLAVRFDWAAQLTELRQRLLQGLTDANAGT